MTSATATQPDLQPIGYDADALLEVPSMATVYRRGGIWWCAYRGWDGRRRVESTGVRDKRVARYIAGKRELRHALAAAGELDPIDLETADHGRKPPDEFLDRFLGDLASAWVRRDHETILRDFFQVARVGIVAEFGNPMIVGKIHAYLATIRGVQVRRRNMHLRAIKRFGEWLYRRTFTRSNEAAKVELLPERADERKVPHRGFTPQEAAALLAAAPPARERWYRFRLWTGLRGEEAIKLRRTDLAGDDLQVRSEVAKNRLACRLPLCSNLQDFHGLRIGSIGGAHDPLFPEIPTRREERRADLSEDLKAAGLSEQQLNERSFRMTYCTWLEAAGVEIGVRMKLRRDTGRGSERLTNWTYSDWPQVRRLLAAAMDQTVRWHGEQLQAGARGGKRGRPAGGAA